MTDAWLAFYDHRSSPWAYISGELEVGGGGGGGGGGVQYKI